VVSRSPPAMSKPCVPGVKALEELPQSVLASVRREHRPAAQESVVVQEVLWEVPLTGFSLLETTVRRRSAFLSMIPLPTP
jgi:hypothetical protein